MLKLFKIMKTKRLLDHFICFLILLSEIHSNWARRSRNPDREEANNNDIQRRDDTTSREAKHFALFNVVRFKCDPCVSQIRIGGTNRNFEGLCYSASQCHARGGRGSGRCAAGFGVCCVFLVTNNVGGSGGNNIVSENCSYIQNPGFPSAYASDTPITYTINKVSAEICNIRLDFDVFNTLGPTDETGGGICPDPVTFNSPITSVPYPEICGLNTGEHVYIEPGNLENDQVTVNFNFATNQLNADRRWSIKVSQIFCSIENPQGCFQYFTTTQGTIKSFNYDNDSAHIRSQNYKVCVRQSLGYCCIEYTPCDLTSFRINNAAGSFNLGLIDGACKSDYLLFVGGTNTCGGASNLQQTTRICGTFFSAQRGQFINSQISVCDCSEPFDFQVVTDNLPDTNQLLTPRGFCLRYRQRPCSNSP